MLVAEVRVHAPKTHTVGEITWLIPKSNAILKAKRNLPFTNTAVDAFGDEWILETVRVSNIMVQ